MARFFALLFAAAVLLSTAALGQDSTVANDGPDWINDDSILVERPSWISATVAKDIVVLSFRAATSSAQRAAIIKRVHGTVAYHDHQYGADGYYYVKVASHPDACGSPAHAHDDERGWWALSGLCDAKGLHAPVSDRHRALAVSRLTSA